MRIFALFFLLASSIFFVSSTSIAEPWISNRFAQNCAGCHSPSRRNVSPSERRCTLACQGCHVSPNGGGIRSSYGYWNQQRFLRSLKADFFTNKDRPAPLKFQKYANMPEKPTGTALKKIQEMAKEGPALIVTSDLDYNESDYDRTDRQEHINVSSREEFLARLTEDDPWRIERKQNIFAGGDFRYFYLDIDRSISGASPSNTSRDYNLPMGVDLGVRVRPTREHVQAVFEHRYLNGPAGDASRSRPDWAFTNQSQVRSAYMLVDDLPYNTYVQYGIYRPLFGLGTADHTSLANSIVWSDGTESELSRDARSSRYVNRALSIGGSPNVPFVNLHMIKPLANTGYPQDDGFAVNLGGRHVIKSLSYTLSYWSTKFTNGTYSDLDKKMINFNVGAMFGNLIVNYDTTQVDREFAPGSRDKGNVETVEAKYRIWREVYLMGSYAISNTTPNLKEGESEELMAGLKAFLWPGSEFELLIIKREDTSTSLASTWETDLVQGQVHLFF